MPPPSMTLLSLEPAQVLRFAAGYGEEQQTLKLTNKHSGCVAFKVKSTAPKSYLVRPSSGTLKPHEHLEVKFTLRKGADGQAASHQLLVQAVATSSDGRLSKEEWNQLAEAGKDKIQEQQLNVEQEDGQAAPATSSNSQWSAPAAPHVPTSHPPPQDLTKAKYDHLVKYVLDIEAVFRQLEADIAKQTRKKKEPVATGGVTAVQLLLVALISFMLTLFGTKYLM